MANSSQDTFTSIPDFSNVDTSNVLVDERGREMRFPTRGDYLGHLMREGFVRDEKEFLDHPELIEAVYLDWLRRPQIGCVFAQLLGRPRNRKRMQTLVIGKSDNRQQIGSLAQEIDAAVQDAIGDPEVEAISVLLPSILDVENIAHLMLALSHLPQWTIELERPWRSTMTLIGLRVQTADNIWAETLGVGPFQFLPPTRQGPITSLEIRTKSRGVKKSKLHPSRLAAHLADIPTDEFMTPKEHGVRSRKWTPMLRERILGGNSDERAKAGITFAVPAAIWRELKSHRS